MTGWDYRGCGFLVLIIRGIQNMGGSDIGFAPRGSAHLFGCIEPSRTPRARLPNEVQNVRILHHLEVVREREEKTIDLIEFVAIQLEPQPFAAQPKSMASGVFAQNQLRAGNPHGLRGHYLVGQRVLDYAILVNTRLMRERVTANDGFVGLYRRSRNFS